MRHGERLLVGLVVLMLAVSSLGVVAVGVSAQSGASDPANSTAPGAVEEDSTVVAQVDDQVRITAYSYDEDREVMSVTLEHTAPQGERSWATLTESVEAQEGGSTGSFGITQVRIEPGETVVAEVDAKRKSGGAAIVLVATQRSVSQGTGAFVSDVKRPSLGLFTGSATWGLVRLGTIGGTLGVITVALLFAWHLVADTRDRAEVEV